MTELLVNIKTTSGPYYKDTFFSDSVVHIAYVQVFANYWEIEQCTSNLLYGQTFDYVESCEGCVSTYRPYSCCKLPFISGLLIILGTRSLLMCAK